MKLPPRVVALSPGDLAPELCDTFAAAARAALDAGLRGLLLREAALEDGAFLALARALAALRDEHDAWFGVHDRAHIARLVGADGLHLGFRSLAPADVPAAWRAGLAVGLSTHAHDHVGVEEGVQGDDDAWRDADYLFHGPVLDTPSKRGLLEPVGFGGLAAAVSRAQRPVWGIGGMRPEHAAEVMAAGAEGVAVLSGVFGVPDPAAAAAAYVQAFARAHIDEAGGC